MNSTIYRVAVLLVTLFGCVSAKAQETITRNGYTLKFTSLDPLLNETVKTRLIDAFFVVYPKLTAEYNTSAVKEVTFFVDTAYAGVAEAGGGRVRFSDKWLRLHPGDIDVVTHEVMHLVQSYPHDAGPGWLTEGIADYVRYRFGVDNKGGGWFLPPYNPRQSYTNSYRITARFLVWMESKNPGFVKNLDSLMRTKTYTPEVWKNTTGKTVDELWVTYGNDPVIP